MGLLSLIYWKFLVWRTKMRKNKECLYLNHKYHQLRTLSHNQAIKVNNQLIASINLMLLLWKRYLMIKAKILKLWRKLYCRKDSRILLELKINKTISLNHPSQIILNNRVLWSHHMLIFLLKIMLLKFLIKSRKNRLSLNKKNYLLVIRKTRLLRLIYRQKDS